MTSKKSRRFLWGLVLLIYGLSFIGLATVATVMDYDGDFSMMVANKLNLSQLWEEELEVGQYFTIVDQETDETVDMLSRVVYPGDRVITEDNKEYEVVKTEGNKALAKMTGEAKDVVWKPEWDELVASVAGTDLAVQGNDRAQIGVYYTHTAESYVPTDGSESIPGKGGIVKVGSTLSDALRKNGVSVVDDQTSHEPHDSAAYHRSRRTAIQLLKKQPIALIDVHRDGIPDPGFYEHNIAGQDLTQIRLVVGRQNPNMNTNLEFAKRLKGLVDKEKPGLVKAIFIGRGNYNQDLGPKAMLIEVGTHTNSRFLAENGATLFANALPTVLNLQRAEQAPGGIAGPITDSPAEGRAGWTTLAWILGIVLVGVAGFLFISTGSIEGVKSKISELGKTEFANYFGSRKKAIENTSKGQPDTDNIEMTTAGEKNLRSEVQNIKLEPQNIKSEENIEPEAGKKD